MRSRQEIEKRYCLRHSIHEIPKCSHCGNLVKFNGKYYPKTCCRECTIYVRSKNSIKTRTTVMKDGFTISQIAARKGVVTRKNDIVDGLNSVQRAAIKREKKMREIVDENGQTLLQLKTKKMIETKRNTIINGLDTFQRCARKAAVSMRKIQNDGKTQYQKNSIKMLETKFSDIDNLGLNSFQRAAYKATETKKNTIDAITGKSIFHKQFEKQILTRLKNEDKNTIPNYKPGMSCKSKRYYYKNTNIGFQGQFELDFLKKIESFNLFNLLCRPGFINYLTRDNKKHFYRPDFLLKELNYIEIKSALTYDCSCRDLKERQLNHLKWRNVLEQIKGSRFFVIWNKIFIREIFIEDLIKSDNLFVVEKCLEFNKENLKMLLNKVSKVFI